MKDKTAPIEEWMAAQDAVIPERAVEALARHNHDQNNDHGWYDSECLNYQDNHREPHWRLHARAGLTAVIDAGFEVIPYRLSKA